MGASCYFGGKRKDQFFVRYLLNYSKVWQLQISRFGSVLINKTMIENTLGLGTRFHISKNFEGQVALNTGSDRIRFNMRIFVSGGLSLRYNF